jgi:type VI secretion system secreted protein Hcp
MSLAKNLRVFAGTIVAVAVLSSSALASQVDYFLKIDGISGESRDDRHKEWIEILSTSHAMLLPAIQSARAGGGAQKVEISDYTFSKRLDASTPKLMEACASGKHIAEAELHLVKQEGNSREPYLIVKLKEVYVTSYQTAGSTDDRPLETFSLNFGAIDFEYFTQDDTGQTSGSVKFTWDLKENKKI